MTPISSRRDRVAHSRSVIAASACSIAAGLAMSNAAYAQNIGQIWKNDCASCHGERGAGGKTSAGADVPSLLDDAWKTDGSDRALFDAIKTGMPGVEGHAFSPAKTDAQIWSMVVNLREIRARDVRKRNGSPTAKDGVYTSKLGKFSVEEAIPGGLDVPWAVDFVPMQTPKGLKDLAGAMLVTERAGTFRVATKADPKAATWTLSEPVAGMPKVAPIGQGGLMDVAVHPDFASNGWIYLGLSDPVKVVEGAKRSGAAMTIVVRGKLERDGTAWKWTNQETIYQAAQDKYTSGGLHFGCKIVFDPPTPSKAGATVKDRYVFWSIGERGQGKHAQDLTRPNGKVHRLHDDGRIPADNPFVDEKSKAKGYDGSIWSYGHRNPQGLHFDLDGNLWDTEHGPRGGDEVNLVQKGKNYGWPMVSFGIEYSGSPRATPWPEDAGKEIVMPVFVWLPSIGASGLDVVRPGPDGEAFPMWKNDLIAGGLSGANVDRIRIRDGKLVEREELLQGMGRVRDVATGPDGSVYIVLNDPDKVLRMVPVK